MNEIKIVVASGFFDPIHKGHIEYLQLAKQQGDKLIVILNNDEQCAAKKGKPFMPLEDKKAILEAIGCVDEVFVAIDEVNETFNICESLKAIDPKPHIFAKGGDRFIYEIPEAKVCEELGIKIIDNLGKKIQSSSELIKAAKEIIKKEKE